jgi:hypothetical protein
MAITYMQGFELIRPTADYATEALVATDIKKYLEFDPVTGSSEWFIDETDVASLLAGPLVTTDSPRIDGQCLTIKRPVAVTDPVTENFNSNSNLGLSVYVQNTSTVNIGIAVKFSKAPLRAIPLAVFKYDNGVDINQQTTLWLGRTGAVFFSDGVFDIDEAAPTDPAVIETLATPPGAVIFDRYTYIEAQVTLLRESSVASIAVNGVTLLEQVTAGALQAYPNKNYINQVIIVNPMAAYFPDGGYDMSIDDLYIGNATGANAGILGPQHIKRFELSGPTAETAWTANGEATNYECVNGLVDPSEADLTYISADGPDKRDLYELTDVPAAYTTVNCVKVTASVSVTEGAGTMNIIANYTGVVGHNTSIGISIPDSSERYVRTALFNTVYASELTVARMNTMWIGVYS